jgi:hypothetical protein
VSRRRSIAAFTRHDCSVSPVASEAELPGKCTYGFGEVVTLISVFSSFVVVLLPPGGFTTVVLVSFFSDGGFTIVVLLSFFSAGGLTVVVFCSHAANKPNMPTGKSIFSYYLNRILQPFGRLFADGTSGRASERSCRLAAVYLTATYERAPQVIEHNSPRVSVAI